MSPRFTAVLVFRVVVLQRGWISETRPRIFTGEIKMHGSGYAGLHIAKRIAAVLPHAVGRDQPLSVLLHAGGDRLLITGLDERFAIVAGDLHIAGEHEQRCASRGDDREAFIRSEEHTSEL